MKNLKIETITDLLKNAKMLKAIFVALLILIIVVVCSTILSHLKIFIFLGIVYFCYYLKNLSVKND